MCRRPNPKLFYFLSHFQLQFRSANAIVHEQSYLVFFFGIRDCRRKHILIVIVIGQGGREENKTRNSNQIAFATLCQKRISSPITFSDGNQSENTRSKKKKGRFACFYPQFCYFFVCKRRVKSKCI